MLSLPILLVIGLALGAFFPAYASSQQLVFAALVGDDETRLTRVTGLLGSVNETASFGGPAIGGLLIALIGPSAVLLIDAGTFVIAFCSRAVGGAAHPAVRGDRGGPQPASRAALHRP